MTLTDSPPLRTREAYAPMTLPVNVAGGVLTGPGTLLSIWATAYNKGVAKGATPQDCAKHAVHEMLTQGKMADIRQISYQAAAATDPGAPSTFNFNPGQYFPIDGQVTWSEMQAQLSLALAICQVNLLIGLIVLAAFIIMDLIVELINLFTGKPRALDTVTIGNRLCTSQNPAGYIAGTLLLRNLSQNDIVLSSSNAKDQQILGEIRRQAYNLIVAQGQTEKFATATIDYVWSSSNDKNFKLPEWLKTWPQKGTGNQPPPNMPQPCIPSAQDGQGDELTDGLACASQNLAVIAAWMPYLWGQLGSGTTGTGGGGGTTDPVTCTQLTGLLDATNGALAAIATAIATAGAGGGTPIDLAPIVKELTVLAAAAQSYPPLAKAIGDALNNNLAAIASAILTAPGTDVSSIAKPLAAIAPSRQVMPAVVEAWLAEGLIDGSMSQLINGSPGLEEIIEKDIPGATTVLRWAKMLGVKTGVSWSDVLQFITPEFIKWFVPLLAQLEGLLRNTYGGLKPGLLGDIEKIGEGAASVAGLPAIAALEFVLGPVQAMGHITPGQQTAAAQQTFGRAWAMGETAHLLAIIAGLLPDGLGFAFSGWAALVAEAAGFREIATSIHRPYYGVAFGRPTAYQANAATRSLFPTYANAQSLAARGLITAAQLAECEAYGGLQPAYVVATERGAYHGMNARQLLRLIETGLFTNVAISDELTFSGMRPISQTRMQTAAPFLATAAQRTELIDTVESACVQGLLADADVRSLLSYANSTSDQGSLILATAHLKILIQETKDLESEYSTLYYGGVIDDLTFRSYLSGIGLQQWKINTVAGKAEARANAMLQRKTIAAAAALARTTAAEERKTAMKNYSTGSIDAAALAAALVVSGLTPIQAAAWVDLAVLQMKGNLRWVHGLTLNPNDAKLLTERVAALSAQRSHGLITDAQLVAQLSALTIPKDEINAIVAKADASAAAAKLATLWPVETS